MFSIKAKIILAYTVIFGALLIVFCAVIYHSTRHANFAKFDERLTNFAMTLRVEIEEQTNDEELLDVKELQNIPAEGLLDANIRVIDSRGNVLLGSRFWQAYSSKRWKLALKGTPVFETIDINGEQYRFLTWPVKVKKGILCALQTAASMREINADLNRLFVLFLLLIPIALLLTGLAAYFVSKAAFKPILKMAAGARSISLANLKTRVELPRAKDEVRLLGETLNDMIGRIEAAYSSQKQFIASASHELRTPLTIMQAELELAEKKLHDSAAAANISIALAEIDSLSRLTRSLLLLSQLDAVQLQPHRQPLRLDELLIECIQAMKSGAAKKNIRLDLTIAEAIEIVADREKLKSVCLNLIENAVKYTKENGTVTVTLEAIDHGFARFSVQDSGPGIPPEDLPYIFDRFFRSDETRANAKGSGLGLAIVKELVTLHHGTVSVQNLPHGGAFFEVKLPLF
jgi:two-component system, OmpR family, sensor kinase